MGRDENYDNITVSILELDKLLNWEDKPSMFIFLYNEGIGENNFNFSLYIL